MKKFELNEFQAATHQEWRDKIITDLRGKDIKSLYRTTRDGIRIQPDYTLEDFPDEDIVKNITNITKRGCGNDAWFINQVFDSSNEKSANSKILDALGKGVDSIEISVNGRTNFNHLLKDIMPQHIQIRFVGGSLSAIRNYAEWAEDKGYNTHKFEGSFGVYFFMIESISERIEMANLVANIFPKMTLISVNGDYFFNQGANNVQQIGISLSLANEALEEMTNHQIASNTAADLIGFSLAAGSDFFTEIAKFRAFRVLWDIILTEYQVFNHSVQLHGLTSTWTQAVLDINNNMLRSSTQALSAVLGGCQTVTVVPYDAVLRSSNEFSERLARNIQLIIRDEAFAGKVKDVASGSYFIENLTLDIAEKAWLVFLAIENAGGYKKAMEKGLINKWVAESRENAWKKVQSGEVTILGVNKYPNLMENKNEILLEKERNNIRGITLSDAFLSS